MNLSTQPIINQYVADIAAGLIEPDEAQKQAIKLLQCVCNGIMERQVAVGNPWGMLKSIWLKNFKPARGLYLWGGVGRGKTYLMDLFYNSLPIKDKTRIHFHRFMLKVHTQLTAIEGHDDPLQVVADNFAKESRVICFDEFYVSDIADAMILGTLLRYLFNKKIVIVFTSNVNVDDLYNDGLQRQKFIKAITLLKKNCNIFEVDSGVDYRFKVLSSAGVYHLSSEPRVYEIMKDYFNKLAPVKACWNTSIEVDGRNVSVYGIADDVVWFTFSDICRGPRSSRDYIEIASCFHTVIVSDIPIFTSNNEDEARRFIALIDELYDRSVNFIGIAATDLDKLYKGVVLQFQFRRTVSRLTEMQASQYLSRQHNP